MEKGMVATPKEIEDILTLDSFKRDKKYPTTNFVGGKLLGGKKR